jgi:hypothetical protein
MPGGFFNIGASHLGEELKRRSMSPFGREATDLEAYNSPGGNKKRRPGKGWISRDGAIPLHKREADDGTRTHDLLHGKQTL